MDYISVRQAADKWNVSVRQVQALIKDGRIEGAARFGGHAWMVPSGSKKPDDLRTPDISGDRDRLAGLRKFIAETTKPMPRGNPDSILNEKMPERVRIHYESELAYMRGDYGHIKKCFRMTEEDELSRLRACSLSAAAAVSTGDYDLYNEIEQFLRDIIAANNGNDFSKLSELSLSSVYTGAFAVKMVPEWIKKGDFSALHFLLRTDAVYKWIKYLQCAGRHDAMLAAANAAVTFYGSPETLTLHDIYFRVTQAIANINIGNKDEAERILCGALEMALPHGFTVPFAESATAFGGTLERILEQKYPVLYDKIIDQWKYAFVNWISFHNKFTKNNVTYILSLREYEIAQLAARRVPYSVISKQFNISVGRINNIIHEIYSKLYIKNRNELAKYLM